MYSAAAQREIYDGMAGSEPGILTTKKCKLCENVISFLH